MHCNGERHVYGSAAILQGKVETGLEKEYREMDEKKFIDTVYLYMSHWMLLKKEGTNVILLPATGRQTGYYPGDFVEKQ